jgi:hypothetical protein
MVLMTTKNLAALCLTLEWAKREASENPRSPAARLKPASLEAVTARLEADLPNANDEERRHWMLDFEHRYPTHFDKYAYRGDIKDLTGKERWRLINGEQLPAIQTKKTAK